MNKALVLALCVACFTAGRLSISKPVPQERQIKMAEVPAPIATPQPSKPIAFVKVSQAKQRPLRLLKQARDLSRSQKPEDIERANDFFAEIVADNPNSLQAIRDYSNFLLLQQDPDAAFPLLKKCLELNPTDDLCAGNFATYFSMKNDLDGLGQASNDCLTVNPNNMGCLSNRGNYYLQTQDFADALAVFQKMEVLDQSASIHFNMSYIYHELGMSYEGLGNLAMARESFGLACSKGDAYACTLAQEL